MQGRLPVVGRSGQPLSSHQQPPEKMACRVHATVFAVHRVQQVAITVNGTIEVTDKTVKNVQPGLSN
jgi:hypothetical protein